MNVSAEYIICSDPNPVVKMEPNIADCSVTVTVHRCTTSATWPHHCSVFMFR